MGDHRQEYPFLERNALSKNQHMPSQPLSQGLLGKDWIKGFLGRHHFLQAVKRETILMK